MNGLKLAVLSDFLEERWPSMDLVSEMLVEHAGRLPGIEATSIRPKLPRTLADWALAGRRFARPAALAFGRYALYPMGLPRVRARFDCFHVADHSYAHLALGLPKARTGVFCHDIDAFRPMIGKSGSGWRRSLAKLLLEGMRRASLVFYSTEAVRLEIEEHQLVDPKRLVAAPYGISHEFQPHARDEDAALRARPPFLLHVGSLIPRKNPLFLLRLFAAARLLLPNLELVQVGGEWDAAARDYIEKQRLGPHLHGLRGITREELAAHYRSAVAVLLPSTSEGFGLPVIEALACGAAVVVSDIPVLCQVGGDGAVRCAVDDLDAWRAAVLAAAAGRGPDVALRLRAASRYTWQAHAATIVGAYAELAGRP
jgi:glycosyltransferase involved in cell wall biosynthesis